MQRQEILPREDLSWILDILHGLWIRGRSRRQDFKREVDDIKNTLRKGKVLEDRRDADAFVDVDGRAGFKEAKEGTC